MSEAFTVIYDSGDKDISCLVVARRDRDKFTHTVISEFYGEEADKLYHDLLKSKGEWITHKDWGRQYGCNRCGNLNDINSRYCPNCGVKMKRGEENESN